MKTIADVINDKIINAKEKYAEAEASYNDTGSNKYWNQMKKYKKDIEELEEYTVSKKREKELDLAIKNEKAKYEETIKTIKNKVDNLLLSDENNLCLISLKKFLNQF